MEPPSKRFKQEHSVGLLSFSTPAQTPGSTEAEQRGIGVGADTLQRLQSVERFFCSQTLSTPSLRPVDRALTQISAEEFSISYSQNYTRIPSQPSDKEPEGAESRGDGELASTASAPLEDLSRRTRDVAAGPNTTPELCQPEPCHSRSPPPTSKLFPIFRPVSQRKVLHIIRHGESEYNAATQFSKSFEDPRIFDPKLTAKGRKQAERLQPQLERMKISGNALWVSSPLTRALETMLLACPHAARIGSPEQPLNVAICGDLSEHVVTTGDIGLPKSHVQTKFPQFSTALQVLPERWWFCPQQNDAVQERFDKHENKKSMQSRVGNFRKWVQSRPEKVIVAFGHSSIFHELMGRSHRLKNCELHTMNI